MVVIIRKYWLYRRFIDTAIRLLQSKYKIARICGRYRLFNLYRYDKQ